MQELSSFIMPKRLQRGIYVVGNGGVGEVISSFSSRAMIVIILCRGQLSEMTKNDINNTVVWCREY